MGSNAFGRRKSRRVYLSFSSRGTRPASVPGSVAGPCGAKMPKTRIAFSPKPKPLAAVCGTNIEPGELLHALEPVAHGVAVGVEALGGLGDVAVGVEERVERADELGLVLLVVDHERGDRLLVEAAQLLRVLHHRG